MNKRQHELICGLRDPENDDEYEYVNHMRDTLNEESEKTCNEGIIGTYRYTLGIQRINLGLYDEFVDSFRGKRKKTLDIACGEHADLVHFFRQRGIHAEGIDPLLPEDKDYFMRQGIRAMKPLSGHIPREDGTYDLVTIHSSTLVLDALSKMSLFSSQESTSDHILPATFMVLEGMRLLKKEGEFRCWPAITKLNLVQYGFNGEYCVQHNVISRGQTPESMMLQALACDGNYCTSIRRIH